MGQCISSEQVNESFIANAPLISATIKNMTLQAPSWYRDLYTPQPWPEDEGNSMQEIEYRGELPQVEEGFDAWELVDDPSGCGVICAPNCSYNFSTMGGNSFQTKINRLMKRDFKTPPYCVEAISSTRQYGQVFSAIIQNLYNQLNFQKEVNVGQNFMSTISKKFLVDGAGIKANPEDPWAFRPKGTATLAAMTLGVLERFYGMLRMMPTVMPYAYSNNMPLFALVASPEMHAYLYRADPNIRADLRAAAAGSDKYADDLIQRYAFNYTIRDMFLPVQYLTPRRFRYDSENNVWIRVLPYVRGVKGTVGTYTDINPQYEDPSYATHEAVQIHGRDPMSVLYKTIPQTIGEGTSFGPEPGGFWDVFQWSNPETRDDPGRREGFFWTTAKISLQADNEVFEIMFPRPPASTMIAYHPAGPVCPPTADVCTNTVPAVACPSATIVSFEPHPVTAGTYFVTFSAAVDAEDEDVIMLESSSGAFVNATVVEDGVSADSKTFEVTIPGNVPVCERFFRVFDALSLACKAKVVKYSVNPADNTQLDLILDLPIRAYTNGNTVTVKYGNGTSVSATLVSAGIDMSLNKWRVDIGGSAFVDNVNGVVEICVPTATVATCPACSDVPTETICA